MTGSGYRSTLWFTKWIEGREVTWLMNLCCSYGGYGERELEGAWPAACNYYMLHWKHNLLTHAYSTQTFIAVIRWSTGCPHI